MDPIPKPDQVVSAASNVAHKMLYGGVADLRPMPRTLIDDGMLREVYHDRPQDRARESGDPVLLVTPLTAPALAYDLRRGCSLVEHLVSTGRRTYLVEYGEVSFANRTLGLEHWVDEVIPASVREVSEHAGGRPVHVVGWSLGGIFSLLTTADRPDLPIASLTVVGSPVDVTKVPPVAQIEAVERFTASMTGCPGRSFGQIIHRTIKGNQLATGVVRMDDRREIALAGIRVPVLVFAGGSDQIAPVKAIEPLVDLLPRAASVRFDVVPGGHLGMLTGRGSRHTTWRVLDEFLDAHASATDVPERPARKTAGKKATAKRTATKSTTRRTAAKKASRTEPAIGSNPVRRYGSASSRSLAARQ